MTSSFSSVSSPITPNARSDALINTLFFVKKFSNALTKLMNDLKSKEEILALFDQKAPIYGNLTFLEGNYNVRLPSLPPPSIALLSLHVLIQRPSRITPSLCRTLPWTRQTKKALTTPWAGHLGRSEVHLVRMLDVALRTLGVGGCIGIRIRTLGDGCELNILFFCLYDYPRVCSFAGV